MIVQIISAQQETCLQPRKGRVLRLPDDGSAAVVVGGPTGEFTVAVADTVVADLVASLSQESRSSAELVARLTGSGGTLTSVLGLQVALSRLQGAGALDDVVLDGGREVARLSGEGVLPVRVAARREPGPRVLSRLTVMTVEDGQVILQSGLTHQTVRLDPRLLPAVISGDVALAEGWPERGVADLLVTAGMLVVPGSEDTREASQWSACDLWFHRRTAESRSVDRYGGTYPLAEEHGPLPYRRDDLTVLRQVELPIPDLDRLRRSDPPLADVVESRRSCRHFDRDRPPTLEQLAELLYRSCRARRIATADAGLDVVDRPFPSGGSIHELDTYLAVTACEDLEPGLWRYAPDRHALELVSEPGPPLRRVVDDARGTARMEADPPVVLVIAARFGRLMWKYETMAYALILKHTGVLMQTVYLNATAMGLGTCALGGASTSSLTRATGVPALAEGIVGVMVLGVPEPGSPHRDDSPWGQR